MTQTTPPTSIKNLIADLEVSRATLYRHIKQLQITPHKIKGTAHLTPAESEQVKNSVKGIETSETTRETYETNAGEVPSDKGARGFPEIEISETGHTNNPDYLRGQIAQLEKKLTESENEKRQLTFMVGEWKGRVTTLEEQNRLLLPSQRPGFFKRLFTLASPPHWSTPQNQDKAEVIDLDPTKPEETEQKK